MTTPAPAPSRPAPSRPAPKSPREKLSVLGDALRAVHALSKLGDPIANVLAAAFLAGGEQLQGVWIRSPEFAALREELGAATVGRMEKEGPALWAEWHRRALSPVTDEAAERRWLAAFAQRLPCGECRGHFTGWLSTFLGLEQPFAAYFEATVVFHNSVNARKGKGIVSVSEAREIWSQP